MKSNKIALITYALIITSLFSMQNTSAQQKVSAPNIIFFLVDDMGWQDTSVPFWKQVTPQNKKFSTPHMQRLAAKSLRFTNAYATPVCTPSRVSLMTGMNEARHRVTNWTSIKDQRTDHNDHVLNAPDWNFNGLVADTVTQNAIAVTTLPSLLKDAGYYTILCGKAHFGAKGTSGENPINLGFIKNIAGSAAGNPASFFAETDYGHRANPRAITADLPNLQSYWGSHTFLTEALTLEAKKAIYTAQLQEKPFFLYMSQYAVHLPFDADPRFVKKYIANGYTESEAAYCALVEGMDKSLGDLMDYLEEKKLTKNTIIIFMSDNGGFSHAPREGAQNTQNWPLRGGKGSVYEGGIREPMMVYWPGIADRQAVSNQYVMIEDFYPTVLEMAGLKRYKTVQQIDGESMVPFIKKPRLEIKQRGILWHYPNKWYAFKEDVDKDHMFVSAFRQGDWKLVYRMRDQKLELYNVKQDIGEKHNVCSKYSKRAMNMAKAMAQKMRLLGAQMPVFVHSGKAVPYPDELLNE